MRFGLYLALDMDMNERFITSGKAAKILGVSASTIIAMCKRGEFYGAYRPGKWWRIPITEVQRMRHPHKEVASEPSASYDYVHETNNPGFRQG